MKTAVVISDTHGRLKNLKNLYEVMEESDYVFHLGDGVADIRDFESRFPKKVLKVFGNCDGGGGTGLAEIEGVKVLFTHGHEYRVKYTLLPLLLKAKEAGAAVALFGHTHRAYSERQEGVLLLNPGSLGDYATPSYAYLVFHEGNVYEKIVPIV